MKSISGGVKSSKQNDQEYNKLLKALPMLVNSEYEHEGFSIHKHGNA